MRSNNKRGAATAEPDVPAAQGDGAASTLTSPAGGGPDDASGGIGPVSVLGGQGIPDAIPVGGLTQEPAFRLVELREGPDGDIVGRVRRELIASVYNAVTAQRYAMYEAKSVPYPNALLLLLRPSGSVAGVYVAGSGDKAPHKVALRARRMVRQVVPEVSVPKKRKTSRAATVARAPKRRTSRAALPR
jgi:hypothetical protein